MPALNKFFFRTLYMRGRPPLSAILIKIILPRPII